MVIEREQSGQTEFKRKKGQWVFVSVSGAVKSFSTEMAMRFIAVVIEKRLDVHLKLSRTPVESGRQK